MKILRICFDIDKTLVTFPDVEGDYSTVKPIHKNIEFVRLAKSLGHTVILYTARKMGTYSGNAGRALAEIGKITFETLEKFNIPYDEIYFGKPSADFYIDDKAVYAFDNLEHATGIKKYEL